MLCLYFFTQLSLWSSCFCIVACIKKSKSNQSDLKASVIEETPVNQEFKLTGTVLDADGIPLPGASIIEKGTTNGVSSDENRAKGVLSIDTDKLAELVA